jgi:hypothetical protein
MSALDRVKASFVALARGAHPTIDYLTLYRGRVLKQHDNLARVDVQPEDRRLPPMANIPLRTGVPGVDVRLRLQDEAGQSNGAAPLVLVGWENGRPDRPYAALWAAGVPGVARSQIAALIIRGVKVELGDADLAPIQDGVVTGQGKDPYTGLPYWMLGNSSAVVGAKK